MTAKLRGARGAGPSGKARVTDLCPGPLAQTRARTRVGAALGLQFQRRRAESRRIKRHFRRRAGQLDPAKRQAKARRGGGKRHLLSFAPLRQGRWTRDSK